MKYRFNDCWSQLQQGLCLQLINIEVILPTSRCIWFMIGPEYCMRANKLIIKTNFKLYRKCSFISVSLEARLPFNSIEIQYFNNGLKISKSEDTSLN